MAVLLFLLVAFFLLFGGLLIGVVRTQLLIRNLGSSRRSMYEQAKTQLLSQGHSAIRLLIRGLQHKNPIVRRGSVEVLGAIKDPRALVPLLQAIDDHDKTVRWQAISALGAL